MKHQVVYSFASATALHSNDKLSLAHPHVLCDNLEALRCFDELTGATDYRRMSKPSWAGSICPIYAPQSLPVLHTRDLGKYHQRGQGLGARTLHVLITHKDYHPLCQPTGATSQELLHSSMINQVTADQVLRRHMTLLYVWVSGYGGRGRQCIAVLGLGQPGTPGTPILGCNSGQEPAPDPSSFDFGLMVRSTITTFLRCRAPWFTTESGPRLRFLCPSSCCGRSFTKAATSR